MSLENIITDTHKEIVGSRTKNRLTVQISYAMQLIMDFYSTDFLIMMDYIEDISVICNPADPSEINLYQVKTKSSDKQYQLSAIIKDEWYQKLYNNAQKYQGFIGSAAVVCNTDVVCAQKEVFPNARTSLEEKSIKENIKKIRAAIAKSRDVSEDEIDLSQYYFVRSNLSTKGHKEEMEHQFQNFLLTKDSELQVATVKSIYNLLYAELDTKFNNEINEDCTDIQEIFCKKGVDGQNIKDMIACGLAIQIPSLEKLFSDFDIVSVLERKRYAIYYKQIKMDMYSDMNVFVEAKKNLLALIAEVNENGIDDMPNILISVYEQAIERSLISEAYSNESYLKLLIMILTYRYCYGGDKG